MKIGYGEMINVLLWKNNENVDFMILTYTSDSNKFIYILIIFYKKLKVLASLFNVSNVIPKLHPQTYTKCNLIPSCDIICTN